MGEIFFENCGGIPYLWTSHLTWLPTLSKFQIIHRKPNICLGGSCCNFLNFRWYKVTIWYRSTLWVEIKIWVATGIIFIRLFLWENDFDGHMFKEIFMIRVSFQRYSFFCYALNSPMFFGKVHMNLFHPHQYPIEKLGTTFFWSTQCSTLY